MARIRFKDREFDCRGDETVLQCLERNGVDIASSCRSGVCQTCMMRCVEGLVPRSAQIGLKDTLQVQAYFLSCVCTPKDDMEVDFGDAAGRRTAARIETIQPLNELVLKVELSCENPIAYFPGQFLNLLRPDGLARSYSIASVPALDSRIEFHVGLVAEGKMSGWLHREAKAGDAVHLLGPQGTCHYVPGNPEQSLFLLGTGTGLAPLYGIARHALQSGHEGPIHLFHGSLKAEGLYLVEELRAIESANPGFHYHPCVLHHQGENGFLPGSIDEIALNRLPDLKGYRVYLCGDPGLVKDMQKKTFMAGAALKEIHADAFIQSPASGQSR